MVHSVLPQELSHLIDVDGGFLCLTSHWRPNPADPDPEMPGEKVSMSSHIPTHPREACLCGSGRRYGDCCRLERLWYPICPNPAAEGYSLAKPQSATFRQVEGVAVRERLMADPRFRCKDDSQASAFWIFHGDPAVEDPYGLLCFGDLELDHNRTLVVTTMSDLRMQVLLEVLQQIAGGFLNKPHVERQPAFVIDKQTGKMRTLKDLGHRRPGRSRGRKRR